LFISHKFVEMLNKLLMVFLVVLNFHASAQYGGVASLGYLTIPGSARVAGMGGSYFAVKDGDIQLAQFNPSLLDSTMHGKLGMGFVSYFDGIKMGMVSSAYRIKPKVTFGATMQYCNYGRQLELDGLGFEIGQFQAADYSLTLSSGYQLDSVWSLGVSLKNMYSSLANYSSYAIGFDAGVTYARPDIDFYASMLMTNVGFQLKTYSINVNEKLPFNLQVAMVKRLSHAPIRLSAVYNYLQQWDYRYDNKTIEVVTDPITGEIIEKKKWNFGDMLMRHLVTGVEIIAGKNFSIQAAYNYRRRQELKLNARPGMTGFSFGVGFKVRRFHLSYGRCIYHLAGPSNTFSVSTHVF
jgi:hypothetical protein